MKSEKNLWRFLWGSIALSAADCNLQKGITLPSLLANLVE